MIKGGKTDLFTLAGRLDIICIVSWIRKRKKWECNPDKGLVYKEVIVRLIVIIQYKRTVTYLTSISAIVLLIIKSAMEKKRV